MEKDEWLDCDRAGQPCMSSGKQDRCERFCALVHVWRNPPR